MEETSPPLQAGSKPHLEKLTLGVTRILGEWSGTVARKDEGGGLGAGWTAAKLELSAEGIAR